MRSRYILMILAALALSLALVACSGDDDDDDSSDDGGAQTAEPADNGGDDTGDDGGDDMGDDDTGDDSGDGGGFGDGTGTLTIGDETWEITGVGCVFSAEAAQNPDFPFNLSGFTESSTGASAQVSADIYDPSGQERMEGDGVSHNISINDVDDFENPSVSWSTILNSDTVITIDGKTIHGEGDFADNTSDSFQTSPGTLDVECP